MVLSMSPPKPSNKYRTHLYTHAGDSIPVMQGGTNFGVHRPRLPTSTLVVLLLVVVVVVMVVVVVVMSRFG